MKTDLRYTTSDCLDTFPFPVLPNAALLVAGSAFYEARKAVMVTRQEGLTKTYNRFHDPDETIPEIATLRELHVEMDKAVAAAYGWSDLPLNHNFHETKQGTRFTISEVARREVLARLLKLNHERYAEEVKQGLHRSGGTRAVNRSSITDLSQPTLDFEAGAGATSTKTPRQRRTRP